MLVLMHISQLVTPGRRCCHLSSAGTLIHLIPTRFSNIYDFIFPRSGPKMARFPAPRDDVTGAKMAAVRAELRRRDGGTEAVSVAVGDNLSSLIGGIHELNASVSRLLSGLVEQERGGGHGATGESFTAAPEPRQLVC